MEVDPSDDAELNNCDQHPKNRMWTSCAHCSENGTKVVFKKEAYDEFLLNINVSSSNISRVFFVISNICS